MHVENKPTRQVVVHGMYNTSLGKMNEKKRRIPPFFRKGRGRCTGSLKLVEVSPPMTHKN